MASIDHDDQELPASKREERPEGHIDIVLEHPAASARRI
jgi:hypothetical protein